MDYEPKNNPNTTPVLQEYLSFSRIHPVLHPTPEVAHRTAIQLQKGLPRPISSLTLLSKASSGGTDLSGEQW